MKFLIPYLTNLEGEVKRVANFYLSLRKNSPEYKHAVFTQRGLLINNRCFNGKGKCYGCGLILRRNRI